MRFVRFFYFLIFIQAFFLQSCVSSKFTGFDDNTKFKEDVQVLGVAPISFGRKEFGKGEEVKKIPASNLLVENGFLDDLRKTTDPEARHEKIKKS